MLRAIEQVASRISGLVAMIGGIILALMMVQVSLDVAAKYIFHTPIPSTLEIVSAYYMVALVFLPLGVVTRDHEHLEVELFTQHLSLRKVAFFKMLGCVIGAIYCGFLFIEGLEHAIHQTKIGEVWETATFDIPVYGARWFFPAGIFLTLVYLILYAINNFAFMTRGEHVLPDRSIKSAVEAAVEEANKLAGDDGNLGVGHDGAAAD
ncbi:TRAP transporter small permease subunit [Pseudooceanicola sp.]|uniref:TRAP transporter small permease n=1 Tax=Pseudooceanicola sp. TaxID=1914328 RepID=UPI0026159680|nr:TRAP transporter small permease subunit [Pseudooceanicola sp.]MDF1854468.1 TRAP transporter small permease subunit [Pseudooceanicola sp.]